MIEGCAEVERWVFIGQGACAELGCFRALWAAAVGGSRFRAMPLMNAPFTPASASNLSSVVDPENHF